MFGFGFSEILLITALALIVIGPKRLPEVARALGKGFREFKGTLDEVQRQVRQEVQQPLMDAKSDYLEKILAERDKALKGTEDLLKTEPGPPPETGADLGEPEEAKFSDLPYKSSEEIAAESPNSKEPADAANNDDTEKA